MAGLRKRFNTQGITLEQFAFQFIVVLLGVYLAIFFEGKAEDRSRAAEAGAMLQSVVGELEFDEREILEVRQAQAEYVSASETLMDLLMTASQAEEARIDSILDGPMMINLTVFPRRAAYSALVSSGNMGYLKDPDLALDLADLYEHHYVRLINHGDYLDQTIQGNFWPTMYARYLDRPNGRLRQFGEGANVEFRNLVYQQHIQHSTYINRLDEVLEEVRAAKGRLEEYLNQ